MQKAAAYKVQGMQRDASPSNFKPEYAFEILNMRLITDEEGSAFSLVNEKGTTFACSLEDGVTWIPIGQCPTTDSIIVFAISPGNEDGLNAIFSIKEKEGQWTSTKLFQKDLNFQEDSPIETLFNYETEDLKKVYWIDGINPLRCINLAQGSYSDSTTQFDSVLPLTDNQVAVDIERLSGGSFKAGVIQYYLTYFNKYRTESPIIWTSPLLYLANQERGAETDANVNTAFQFDITGLDYANWEYVRLYSVFRSSIDTEPSANIVSEARIDDDGTLTAYDYGTSNTAIVASDLYFVGAKAVKAGTMTVKDQVLFLGNLKVETKTEPELEDLPAYDLRTNTYKSRPFKISEIEGTYYKYDNQLDNTESISTYKNGETYRFGYQLQDKWGNWSNPIFIEDKEIDFAPKMDYTDDGSLQVAQPSMNITDYIDGFINDGFIAARPLVVYPDVRDRKILCQGVVCPTVYNLKDRVDNSPYAQASWFMRPNVPENIWDQSYNKIGGVSFYRGHSMDNNLGFVEGTATSLVTSSTVLMDEVDEDKLNYETALRGSWVEFRHNYALKTKGYKYTGRWFSGILGEEGIDDPEKKTADQTEYSENYYGYARGAEIDSTRGIATIPVNRFLATSESGNREDIPYITDINSFTKVKNYNTGSSAYYVDSNIVTLNSPDLELTEDLYSMNMGDYKFRIVGLIPLTAFVGDMSLETKNPDKYAPENTYSYRGFRKVDVRIENIRTNNIGRHGFKSMVAQNVYNAWWKKKSSDNASSNVDGQNNIMSHLLFPWHITGTIQTFQTTDPDRTVFAQLKRKVLSNIRFSPVSCYLPSTKYWTPTTSEESRILTWTSTDNSIQKFQISDNLGLEDIVYKGNIDSLAMQYVAQNNGQSRDFFYYGGSTENFNNKGQTENGWLPNTEFNNLAPTFTTNTRYVYKGLSLASSIKYKSSPHYAVFLGGTTIGGKTVLEILPALSRTTENSQSLIWSIDENSVLDEIIYTNEKLEDEKLTFEIVDNFNSLDGYFFTCHSFNPELELKISGDHNDDILKWCFNTRIPQSKKWPVTNQSSLEGNGGATWFDTITVTLEESQGQSRLVTLLLTDADHGNKLKISNIKLSFEGTEQTSYLNREGHSNEDLQYYTSFTPENWSEPAYQLGYVYENDNVASLNIQTCIDFDEPGKEFNDIYNLGIDIKDKESFMNYGWLWLGEIYKDTSPTFGGDNEYALQNNKWEIAGNTVPLLDGATLEWSIGDTYYQRFDTLKTYAYADTDENSVIDITSFMVETRLNIDGRYDRNRGQESNLNMSPKNFNLFNKVYTQKNNFFTYSITPKEVVDRLKFPTQITWSLAKTPGENIDQWLNTTMSAILDLDGRKGGLTSLETMGNEIIAFQEKGIANIIYNPRTQISATDGTPIYIANSAKVEGFKYISDNVGSQDKWSIVSSPNGLYFVDLYNKGIYKFNGQLEDISNAQGFHSWCIKNLNKDSKILGFYDYKNKDVYFINSEWDYPCLAFNEFTNSFSSFYSYENAKLAYLHGEGVWVKNDGSIYSHQKGDYNSFFGKNDEDYHVTIVCNQDGNLSKIFNNIEFRADSWEGNTAVADKSIDYLAIETDYQKKTEEPLVFKQYGPSNLKKKFNVWRANIPREKGTRNRFRDVWAKITLGGIGNARKTRLNDIVVYYT